jgi:uncharacterized protein
MRRHWTRRDVLRAGVGGAVLASAVHAEEPAAIPQRVLGKTGVRVPLLGYGTAPTGSKRNLSDAIALYNEAIDLGVTYIDTAPDFTGYGEAQVQLGHVLPDRRKEVFVVTKAFEPERDAALRLIERNLKEMRIEQADLLYAHSVGADEMDPDVVFGRNGTMAALQKAREAGLTRFIGVSGHNRPDRFLRALEEYDVDVMMNAVNFADRYTYDFEGKVWPVAARKNVGLVAMKVFGGQAGPEPLSSRKMPVNQLDNAFRYAVALPGVCCAVIGMATREELLENVQRVRQLRPLTEGEKQDAERIGRRLAAEWGAHFGPA